MRSSLPSDQYASPRPESCRGAAAPRAPSCSPCTQSSSPVAASSAIAARRDPAVPYSTPFTINGVPSSLNSGRLPMLSVLNRHTTSSLLKFEALIWLSGRYLVPCVSAAYDGHSTSLTLAPFCPHAATQTRPAAIHLVALMRTNLPHPRPPGNSQPATTPRPAIRRHDPRLRPALRSALRFRDHHPRPHPRPPPAPTPACTTARHTPRPTPAPTPATTTRVHT